MVKVGIKTEERYKMKVKVDVGMSVDESTASACLKLVETYLNTHPEKTVVPCYYPDGKIDLELVDSDEYYKDNGNDIDDDELDDG